MTVEYVPPTRERLFELADELHSLGRGNDRPFLSVGGTHPVAKVPAVFATARHAIKTAHAGVDLVRAGNELVAVTLFRASLECTVTAMWLVQSREAIRAFLSEDVRTRRALSREMARSLHDSYRDNAGVVAHIDEEMIETIAAPQARNFQQLVSVLQGGHEAYIHYRILSGMVHPCANLTDYYLTPNEDSPVGVTLRFDPNEIGHDAWLFLAVACMMWASRAIDHLDVQHLTRSRLRAIAREIGVPQTLELTPEAEQEIYRQEQKRRHQARRPKRAPAEG